MSKLKSLLICIVTVIVPVAALLRVNSPPATAPLVSQINLPAGATPQDRLSPA